MRLAIKNGAAGTFQCWALLPDGTRNEALPVGGGGGLVDFALDTSTLKNGGAVFFELASSDRM